MFVGKYEYLKVLTRSFADARADRALPMLERFATRYANAELPAWFYYVFCSVKLVAPIKEPAACPSSAPDVRPLGVGECLRRAITRAVVNDGKPHLASHFWPQQVAVGIESGLTLLIFGVLGLLELHPDWVVVKVDLYNAYQELKRTVALQRTSEAESLRF